MNAARPAYSVAEIRAMLEDRIHDVVARYAPPARGSHTTNGAYFTLNPGRADRKVGSFCVHMTGAKLGRWNDYATGQHGDLIDLIGLALGLDGKAAIREARAYLGLEDETPETRRQRDEATERRKARLAREAAAAEAAAAAKRRRAEAMFLAGARIGGTPVEAYLAGRAIDLRALGHAPGALRFVADAKYFHQEADPETGELHRIDMRLPAMVAAICNLAGEIVAVHRTYLAAQPGGRWGKAVIRSPVNGEPLPVKKVWGDYRGAAIRLGNGIGPLGGKGAPLAACPPGSRVYIAEGIETALSARILRPEARVLAAVSLSNMASVALPEAVAEVVLITDGDTNETAQAALARAVAAHAEAGRVVRTWASDRPGEDLNDALRRVMEAKGVTDEAERD